MTEESQRFNKEELTQRQLIDLFRDTRNGYISWHSQNGRLYTADFKWIPDGDGFRVVTEDPFVADFKAEQYQQEMWHEALRAIRHGRITADPDPAFEGHAVAVINYRTTMNLDWGSGAEWETIYVVYEHWFEDGEEYEGDVPWVVIGWDGYP